MKVTYDDEAESIYICLQEIYPGITKKNIDIGRAGVSLDLDSEGNPVGFEIILSGPNSEGIPTLLKHFDINKGL